MKKLLLAALWLPLMALAQSYPSPTYQNLTVLGTLNATIPAANLAAQAANTVLANVTASSASPTAAAMPSCSSANGALKYTSGTGFSCGTTFALTSATLGQFAATTSAQLAGVLSDETGTGSAVFGTSPTIATPTITGSFTATGLVTTADLATQAANTVLANATGSTGSPSAYSMPSCTASTCALSYTPGTGVTTNTTINAATLGGATFASPGNIGTGTPGTAAFTTESATSTTTGSLAGPVIVNPHSCTDTVTISSGIVIMDCLRVGQQFGGSNVTGVRQAIEGYATLTAPTGNPVGVGYYVGGSFTSEAQTGDGGINTTLSSTASSGASSVVVTSATGISNGSTLTIQLNGGLNGTQYEQVTAGTPSGTTIPISPTLTNAANSGNTVQITKGELQGAIDQAIVDSGATNLDVVTGHETNITVASNAAPRVKVWVGAINNGGDAAEGKQWDAAFAASSSSSSVHSRVGLLFAPYGGFFPVDSNGTLIGAYSGAQSTTLTQVQNGIDFTGVQANGFLLAGVVNSNGTLAPSTTNPGFALQGNLSSGSAEVDFVNTDQSAVSAFQFRQKTGASTSTQVLTISPTGSISAPGTGIMPLYTTNGTGVSAPHQVIGSVTLSSGSGTVTFTSSAVFASSTSYVCTGNDNSATAAVNVQNQSGSSVKFLGTGSDVVAFICVGS